MGHAVGLITTRYPGYGKTRVLGRSTVDLPGLGFPRSRANG